MTRQNAVVDFSDNPDPIGTIHVLHIFHYNNGVSCVQ